MPVTRDEMPISGVRSTVEHVVMVSDAETSAASCAFACRCEPPRGSRTAALPHWLEKTLVVLAAPVTSDASDRPLLRASCSSNNCRTMRELGVAVKPWSGGTGDCAHCKMEVEKEPTTDPLLAAVAMAAVAKNAGDI